LSGSKLNLDDLPEVTTHKRIAKLKTCSSDNYTAGLLALAFIFFSFSSSAAFNLSGYSQPSVEADPLAFVLAWFICLFALFSVIGFAMRGAEIEQHTLELEQQQNELCELYRGFERNACIAKVDDPNNLTLRGKIYSSVADDIKQAIIK